MDQLLINTYIFVHIHMNIHVYIYTYLYALHQGTKLSRDNIMRIYAYKYIYTYVYIYLIIYIYIGIGYPSVSTCAPFVDIYPPIRFMVRFFLYNCSVSIIELRFKRERETRELFRRKKEKKITLGCQLHAF